MITALSDYVIIGIKSTVNFLKEIMEDDDYQSARLSTGFVNRHFEKMSKVATTTTVPEQVVIGAAVCLMNKGSGEKTVRQREHTPDPWMTMGKWEIGKE